MMEVARDDIGIRRWYLETALSRCQDIDGALSAAERMAAFLAGTPPRVTPRTDRAPSRLKVAAPTVQPPVGAPADDVDGVDDPDAADPDDVAIRAEAERAITRAARTDDPPAANTYVPRPDSGPARALLGLRDLLRGGYKGLSAEVCSITGMNSTPVCQALGQLADRGLIRIEGREPRISCALTDAGRAAAEQLAGREVMP